jgi:3-oxoacyl-[acyl-carrier protein] reductase
MEHIFISGGTRGIGRAIVRLFLSHGFYVSTCARDQDNISEFVSELEPELRSRLKTYTFDLSNIDRIIELATWVKHDFGHPSILINNAGMYIEKAIMDEDIDFINKTFAINYFAPLRLIQLFGKQMIEVRSGKIINICSTASYQGIPNANAYVSSKHALLGMSRALRKEWAPYGVHVCSISPGYTYTSSWENTSVDSHKLIHPDDIAKLLLQIVLLGDSANVDELHITPLSFTP